MTEKEQFEQWWEREAMDERVLSDYESWLEAGNECMDSSDIIQFQKEMAEIVWIAVEKNEKWRPE